MTDLGKLKWFLGMPFVTGKDYIEVNQTKYLEKILDRFRMSDCHARNTPYDPSIVNTVESDVLANATLYRDIVGTLIYIMTGTRPDMSYVVTKFSQCMSKPTKAHLNAAKHVLKYLKGTLDYGLRFDKSDEQSKLMGLCDSDWGSSEDRKSITGYCFQRHKFGPLISWKSKKQQTIALSSCEVEYVALTPAIILIYWDLRDEVKVGNVNLFFVPTRENPADIFTKPGSQKLKDLKFIRG
ncbi:secreted RxLR effector protein 161-like [Penaeus japonicus]|uniref:secreted RxLR effector protein 161-like n=1 Tax=Penaeus japonicus TaxID=27405 RepID=UPI001C70F817|nr:secreted RxLR effector protein 161-like [Penaeus japonicus]